MNNESEFIEYNTLDTYDKIKLMIAICGRACHGLNKVGTESNEREYIRELTSELLYPFKLFLEDKDFISEKIFGDGFDHLSRSIVDILELVPMVHSGDVSYKSIIQICTSIQTIAEEALPQNIRYAKFLQHLLQKKTEIASQLDIDESEFADIIGRMFDNVDSLNDILNNNDNTPTKKLRN